jgi:hypothetical protein
MTTISSRSLFSLSFLLLLLVGRLEATALLADDNQSNQEPFVFESSAPDCSDVSKTSHRLSCWLWQLNAVIPEQSFKKDLLSITIKDMVCSEFQVIKINSSFVESSAADDASHSPQLLLDVSGIQANCRGKYKSTGGLSGDVRASVVGNDHGLVLTMQVQSTRDNNVTTSSNICMPSGLKTVECTTNIRVPRHGIHFSGSVSAKLIDLFSGSIAHYISSALGTQGCPLMQQYLDPSATHLLQQADEWFQKYLPDETNKEEMPFTSNQHQQSSQSAVQRRQLMVGGAHGVAVSSLTDTSTTVATTTTTTTPTNITNPTSLPVLHSLLNWVNQIVTKHLHQGFLFDWIPLECDAADCGFFFHGLTGFLNHFMHGQISIRTPPVLRNVTFVLPYGATVTLGIDNVTISGVDQLDDLQLLQPQQYKQSATGTLASQVTSPGWNITAHVQLRVDTLPGSSFQGEALEESFEIILNLTNIHAMVETLVQVQDLDSRSVWQIVHAIRDIVVGSKKRKAGIQCLVSSIQSLKLQPNLVAKMIVDSVSIVPDKPVKEEGASLEADLDALVNTVLKLVLTEYPLLVTSLVQGLAGDPGRRALNQYVETLLHQWSGGMGDNDHFNNGHGNEEEDKCPQPSQPSNQPQWVNFTQLEFLNTINRFLNRNQTIRSMNHFLDCLPRVIVNHRHLLLPNRFQDKNHTTDDDDDDDGFSLVIREFKLEHFDALELIEVFAPSATADDSTYVETRVEWGRQTEALPQAVVSVELSYPAFGLSANVNVTAFVGDLEIILGTRIDYDLNKLTTISVADVLTRGQCALVPASEVRLVKDSHCEVGRMGVNVSAIIVLGEGDPILVDTSTNQYPLVQEFLSSVVDWSLGSVREVANKVSEKFVIQAPNLCQGVIPPAEESKDESAMSYHYTILWVVGILFVLGQVGMGFVLKTRKGHDPQHEAWRYVLCDRKCLVSVQTCSVAD